MKFFLLTFTAFFAFIGVIDTKKYDHLDFSRDDFDIPQDDITEDLWP